MNGYRNPGFPALAGIVPAQCTAYYKRVRFPRFRGDSPRGCHAIMRRMVAPRRYYVQEFVNGDSLYIATGSDAERLDVYELDAAGSRYSTRLTFPACLRFMPYAEPRGGQQRLSRARIAEIYGPLPEHPQGGPRSMGSTRRPTPGASSRESAESPTAIALNRPVSQSVWRASRLWRLTFRFEEGEAVDINLIDYH